MEGVPAKQSKARRMADELYNQIVLAHKYLPGDKLPNENELAVLFGVSRITSRGAIGLLVSQGVLKVVRGRGTYVSDNLSPYVNSEFGDLERIRMRLHELYEARLILEPPIAALACERATDEDLEDILTYGEAAIKAIQEGYYSSEIELKFHSAIAYATHNSFLSTLFPIVSRSINETLAATAPYPRLTEISMTDHRQIMVFLRKRDAEGARSAMELHIRKVYDEIENTL
ncbi:MAG TPA: FCD domain-containing protein [Candidatus Acidoferrum sp.]|nr:FCD domain-containing protein [Candidatus Acidoferrum sp.]